MQMMSRRPAGPMDEAEQIHAILKPRFTAPGSGERRRAALAKATPAAVPWAELDALIDALMLRMRVDPRPTQQRPRTRDVTRPAVGPPPIPPIQPTAEVPPTTRADHVGAPPLPPLPQTRKVDGPPPLPPLPSPPALPVTPRASADELEAPPLPPDPKPKKPTATLPVVPAEAVSGALLHSRPGNAPETHLLYEDIVTLSSFADRDGLIISLERLLILSRLEDHVKQFVESNEVKLMSLFESELKSFSKVPKRRAAAVENTMPRAFLRGEKVAGILPLIDGKASIAEIIRQSNLTPVETCSVMSQLKRSGLIEV